MNSIPAMTSQKVHDYLTEIGSGWQRKGVAMELGCWLGASSIALLRGLVKAGYDRDFWAFDKWDTPAPQVVKAKAQGMKISAGQDLKPLYCDNVGKVYSKIKAIKGGMPATLSGFNGSAIEICIFDAPKQEPVFTGCVRALKNFWIEGVTVLGLLDYKFYERHNGRKRQQFRAPVDFMEKYGSHFEVLKSWDDECPVFFRYVKKITMD